MHPPTRRRPGFGSGSSAGGACRGPWPLPPAAISVVLLIDPVELEQLLGIVTERGRVFDELLFDEPPQVVAGRLDGLVLGEAVERCAVGQIGQNGCASA